MSAEPLLGPGREFDLIRRFVQGASSGEMSVDRIVRVGPGDDCAVIADGIAISSDMCVEDVHFRRSWLTSREIGFRAAAAALSDLAAVAARPFGVLASVAAPAADAETTVLDLLAGVNEAAARVGARVIGGDLTASPGPLVLDVVVLGSAAAPVLRSGGRPGDEVWVTGRLGGAAAAVRAWTAGERPDPEARTAFTRPPARTDEAVWLADRGVPVAMLDLSDGIAGDAAHLCAAGGHAILLRAESLPIHPAAERLGPEAAIRVALTGGEDYELCFLARPGAVDPLLGEWRERFGIELTRVGSVEAGAGVSIVDRLGRSIDAAGYSHF